MLLSHRTFAQHLLTDTYFFLEREHLRSGREALCSRPHIWCVGTQRRWQGPKQGKRLTLTQCHLDTGFHQPLLTQKRSWAAQQETAKVQSLWQLLRGGFEAGVWCQAPPVIQALARMPSVGSFEALCPCGWHRAERLTRQGTQKRQGDLWGKREREGEKGRNEQQ